jgi:hypothetical protein
MKGLCCFVLSVFLAIPGRSQTLGGDAAFGFLNLTGSSQLSALGGVNVSNISGDLSLAFHDPALLREGMDKQFSANFNLFFSGIRILHAQGAFYHKPSGTVFSGGVQYIHYGNSIQTDAAGNVMGEFRPYDYSVQVSAGRKYLERWYYGATLKFMQSQYGTYRSDALALDFGLNYLDSSSGFQAGFLAKNMGTQIRTYAGKGEDLPFDLQLGFTKRFRNSPFQVSVTAHRLHRFNLGYNDTLFNADYGLRDTRDGFVANLFRHFVFAGQAYVGEKLELTLAYNVLRRQEMRVPNATGGLSGISFGVGVLFPAWQFRFARSQYINSTSFNQIGLNVSL